MARKSRKHNKVRTVNKLEEHRIENTPTALYARLSRSDYDTGKDSMTNQVDMLRSFAEEYEDLEIAAEFVDDGYTGSNFERPGFEEMMAGVRSGKYKCIIVKDLSRLGRSYLEASDLLEYELPMFGCRFISINDDIDTKISPIDTIIVGLKNIMNQKYAEDLSKKIKASFKPRIQNGEVLGGPVTYGYLRDPLNRGRLIIDEEAAEIVRWIFQMKLQRMNDTEVAKVLNEKGILSPREHSRLRSTGIRKSNTKPWTASGIRELTQNIAYLGHVTHGKFKEKQYLGQKLKEEKKENWIIYENVNPAIISKEIFDRVQEIRPTLRGKGKRKNEQKKAGNVSA